MNKKTIYIVEDMVLNRLMLETILIDNGFEITGTSNTAEKAWEELPRIKPDLILLDINLAGEKDGIWLGTKVYQSLKIPFIYITAYEDQYTTGRILETHPMGFLVKPFNNIQLITTVNIALELNKTTGKNHVLIQDGTRSINIDIAEIVYLQSEGNYVHIYLDHSHFIIRTTLSQILEKLPQAEFQRIHQRNAINLRKKYRIDKDFVEIKNSKLSISIKYKTELKNRLK